MAAKKLSAICSPLTLVAVEIKAATSDVRISAISIWLRRIFLFFDSTTHRFSPASFSHSRSDSSGRLSVSGKWSAWISIVHPAARSRVATIRFPRHRSRKKMCDSGGGSVRKFAPQAFVDVGDVAAVVVRERFDGFTGLEAVGNFAGRHVALD